MSNDEPEIIDAEVVEDDRLPAVIERASSSDPIELPNRQDALLAGNPDRRCVATNSRGDRCRKFAIYGATVCRTHGGATKKVKEAARIRVENASNRLMGKLIEFAFDDSKPPDVQLKAIQNSLDRAGLKPPAEVVLSQGETKPYEQVFDVIGGAPPDESSYVSSGYESAGVDSPPPATAAHTGYGDDESASSSDESESSRTGPPRQATPRETDRDTQAGGRDGARSQRSPAPRDLHITGMAAIRMANEANRESGVFDEQRAIESPHKRYPRP